MISYDLGESNSYYLQTLVSEISRDLTSKAEGVAADLKNLKARKCSIYQNSVQTKNASITPKLRVVQ